MSNVKVNPSLPLYHANSSPFGYSNSNNSKVTNNANESDQTFHDILRQKLEKQVRSSSDAPPLKACGNALTISHAFHKKLIVEGYTHKDQQ